MHLPCLLVLTGAATVLAADAPSHDIVADDYFTLATVTSCAIAPDGGAVVYGDMRWDEALDGRNSDLWVVDTATHESRRLTFDPGPDTSPTWSPDGAWVYFVSAPERAGEDAPPYDGSRQVWRMRPDGGEAQAVTRVEDGIEAYELSADGSAVYYTTGVEHVEENRWAALKKSYSELTYGHGVFKLSALHKLDMKTWRDETLLEAPRVIREFAVSPDGSKIAMLTTPNRELMTNEGWSWVQVFDTASGTTTTLEDTLWRDEAPSPFGWLLGLAWADDSRALAFRVDFDGYPGELFVSEFDDRGRAMSIRISRPGDVTLSGGDLAWRPGTRDICFRAADHARVRVYAATGIRHGKQGPWETLTPGDVVTGSYSFPDRGPAVMAAVIATPERYEDVTLIETPGAGAAYTVLSDANPQTRDWKKPSVEVVSWTAPDGTTVEGVLELPYGYDRARDGALPMVVSIHGGPTSATPLCQRYWIYGRTLFPAEGWAVLSPNYRGSTGFGDTFLVDLIGRENDIEVKDIIAGVDAMVARGVADEDQLAVMGWSNGGFLTNALITQTDRFKAASSGAGVFDQNAQWMMEDTPGHVINYMEGNLPWEDLAEYDSASPMAHAGNITTPTLIHVGENDRRVPVVHSIALHRALTHYLHVPSELVIYPGEGHGLTTMKHRRAKMEWDHAWFDHWVLGTED